MKAILRCISGPLSGEAFRLEGGPVFIFGRHNRATFSLAGDLSASQLHFMIIFEPPKARLIDIGSTNGTVINGICYGGKFGTAADRFINLADGDTILVGTSFFQYHFEEAEREPPARINRKEVEENLLRELRSQTKKIAKSENGERKAPVGPKEARPGASTAIQDVGVAKILAAADERSSLMPELPGYAIVGRIGKGGKANVYHAVRKADNLPVAVKILLGKTISKPRALDLFRREIEITRQLSHPNVIEYIEDGTADGAPYLVLEYADSGSLDDFIYEHPERRLGFVEAKPIMFQVLEALAFIHHQGLVHRDIKPKNILFKTGRDGMLTAKVSDLGLAGRIALVVPRDTVPSLIGEGGTPAYMPPEQLLEINRVLPQSDVFSAAATFYQMLTGATLYKFGADPKDRASTIIDGEITPILQLRPDLPSGLAEVISKGLAYYPENRYADGQEMLEAMRHVME